MIDNFDLIESLLKFDSDDDFYHLQIIKRKKENPELGSNSEVIKTYYVASKKYLRTKQEQIINLCQFNNARAYINLNRRSFEKIAMHTMKKVCDQIISKDFRSVRKAYESVCGIHSNEEHKIWILDIDVPFIAENYSNISETIAECSPIGYKTILSVPTKNGYHIITNPFNISEFHEIAQTYEDRKIVKFDLHKNNPTVLFIP